MGDLITRKKSCAKEAASKKRRARTRGTFVVPKKEIKRFIGNFNRWAFYPRTKEERVWSDLYGRRSEFVPDFVAYVHGYLEGKRAAGSRTRSTMPAPAAISVAEARSRACIFPEDDEDEWEDED